VAPPGLAERIAAEAAAVPGVQGLGEVRLRQAGASIFVDLVVNVDRSASLEEAHQVAEAVDDRITHIVPHGDVIVHVDPVRRSGENLTQTVSAIAARLGLRTHDVHAHQVRGRYSVDLHVEVPADLTLGQAHDRVCQMEAAVRAELPHVRDIHSHIEPLAPPVVPVADLDKAEEQRLRALIKSVVSEVPGLGGYCRLHIRPGPGGYDVVLHCPADPELPVAEAHRLADQVEKLLHARIPGLKQVLIHVTPEGEDGDPSRGHA
jgi:divalent metal cation (Fe/Co/Zn/Cd) transporter